MIRLRSPRINMLSVLAVLIATITHPSPTRADNANDYQWSPWRTIGTATVTQAETTTRSFYPSNEFGLRYWSSSGGINYNVEKPKISRLDYKVNGSVAGETYFRMASRNERYVMKGLLGLGGEQTGHVQDLDYNQPTNANTISDTTSSLKNGRLLYVSADLGYKLNFLSTTHAATSVLTGLGYYQDVVTAHGLVCNQISTGSLAGVCNSAGQVLKPNSVKTLQEEAEFSALRIGLEHNWRPTRRLTWRNEVMFVPYANFTSNDFHYLRSDLGSEVPNFRDFGIAYGAQLETTVDFKVTPRWSVNFGGRYWEFWSSQTKTKVGNPVLLSTEKSYDWKYTRAGIFAGATYHF